MEKGHKRALSYKERIEVMVLKLGGAREDTRALFRERGDLPNPTKA